MNDAQDSLRQSFVGVNDYQRGQAYGEQVVSLMDENTRYVLILLDSEEGDLEKNQIYSLISNAVMQVAPTGKPVRCLPGTCPPEASLISRKP